MSQDITVNVSDGRAGELDIVRPALTALSSGLAGPAIQSLSSNTSRNLARLDFGGRFANGRYRITFPLGSVTDAAGNRSPAYSSTSAS